MSILHRVHEGPGQGAGPTLPRAVERGAAARADRAHRRDHRVQDPGQGLGTQTRQAGLSEYWRVVTKHLTQMDHHCSNLEKIYIEISRYAKDAISFYSHSLRQMFLVFPVSITSGREAVSPPARLLLLPPVWPRRVRLRPRPRLSDLAACGRDLGSLGRMVAWWWVWSLAQGPHTWLHGLATSGPEAGDLARSGRLTGRLWLLVSRCNKIKCENKMLHCAQIK